MENQTDPHKGKLAKKCAAGRHLNQTIASPASLFQIAFARQPNPTAFAGTYLILLQNGCNPFHESGLPLAPNPVFGLFCVFFIKNLSPFCALFGSTPLFTIE